jgi:hypothetical protein
MKPKALSMLVESQGLTVGCVTCGGGEGQLHLHFYFFQKKKRVRRGAEEAEEWQVLFPSLSGVLRLWLLHPPLWRRNLQFQQDPFCSVKWKHRAPWLKTVKTVTAGPSTKPVPGTTQPCCSKVWFSLVPRVPLLKPALNGAATAWWPYTGKGQYTSTTMRTHRPCLFCFPCTA